MAAPAGSCRERHPKSKEENELGFAWHTSSIANTYCDIAVSGKLVPLVVKHLHICGFTSHCAVVFWSPLLSRHQLCRSIYTTNLQDNVVMYFIIIERKSQLFCQLVHTSCMAHLWGFVHVTFGYSLLNLFVCSENLRLTRDAISLHHVTSKWLSDFWDFEIPCGKDLWKVFWRVGVSALFLPQQLQWQPQHYWDDGLCSVAAI